MEHNQNHSRNLSWFENKTSKAHWIEAGWAKNEGNQLGVVYKLPLQAEVGRLWKYGLWSFQTGGTKLEMFLPKNQHP